MKQIALLLFLFLLGCQSENEASTTNDQLDATPVPYPSFKSFPDQQYAGIQLNQTTENVVQVLTANAAELMYSGEVLYFRLPEDSTELIIPNTPTVTEFKVFLKGHFYLRNPADFNEFLFDQAEETNHASTFSIAQFPKAEVPFKLTCFQQDDAIRLHFMSLVAGG